ncbi:MAG TPA: hypothetical protein VFC78_22570 [Tepidisphaeraceae bacterium]|nr:hypothetical protein [Tepidisphaeraceae bacterium]
MLASSAGRSASSAATSAGSNTDGSTRNAEGPNGASDGSFSTHCSIWESFPIAGSFLIHQPPVRGLFN